jgi:ABC-type dipeptide/oligopeptide/nickel transport system ATPase component
MRILRLEIEDTLNIKAVSIDTHGKPIVRLTGKNGAGKSSAINAMFYALAGAKGHASEPIRTGAKRATVRVMMGEKEVKLTAILKLTADGKPTLDIEASEGSYMKRPQETLNAIIGQLTFDPHAFERMTAKQRLETLKSLVKLDVDPDALDRANEKDYAERTTWNHRVNSFKERVKTVKESIDETMDVSLVDVSELTGKMASASEHNQALRRIAVQREDETREINNARNDAATKRADARLLLEEADSLDRYADSTEKALANAPALGDLIDVTALKQQIDAALLSNSVVEQQLRMRQQMAEAKQELDAASVMSENLTAAIKNRDQEKADAMARAKMPIEGLGFGNGDVTYNGLPFEQSSTGQRLRIAVSIGMAINPQLRVLCIRDAALLDEDSMKVVEDLAEEHDFQVWLEVTQSKPGKVGLHFVDGAITSIDGEPVEQPAAEEEAATAGV